MNGSFPTWIEACLSFFITSCFYLNTHCLCLYNTRITNSPNGDWVVVSAVTSVRAGFFIGIHIMVYEIRVKLPQVSIGLQPSYHTFTRKQCLQCDIQAN